MDNTLTPKIISLVDSYTEANRTKDQLLYSGSNVYVGQTFHNRDAATLVGCEFYMKSLGTVSGTMYAKLYSVTGSFGSTAIPTGSALATSEFVMAEWLTTSSQLILFSFSDSYQLAADTDYCICVYWDGTGDASNCVKVGSDDATLTHSGNGFTGDGSTWSYINPEEDVPFYVYSQQDTLQLNNRLDGFDNRIQIIENYLGLT